VDRVLGGRSPIGRRVRYLAGEAAGALGQGEPTNPGPWYEIVGVARDIGTTNGYGRAGIYVPMANGAFPRHVVIHVTGDARAFAPTLRAVASAQDPTMRLYDVMPLSNVVDQELRFYSFWVRITYAVSGVALLLSLAGIYAVMAFTVSRRTREIGVRVALGSSPRRILTVIFRRPLLQVAFGVLAGAAFVAFMAVNISTIGAPTEKGAPLTAATVVWELLLVSGYAVLVILVCALACLVPTRRALAVQPMDALRAEG
jgi:hypothetical protein